MRDKMRVVYMTKPTISVFFPCYNDKGTIGILVSKSIKLLKPLAKKFEVIVIDDGSTDGSRELLTKLKQKHSQLKLVFHSRNKGYGGALRSGFKTAANELVFYTDGDAQYAIEEMPLLLPLMTKDVAVVNGIKMERGDAWYRVVIGNLYNFIMRNAFDIDLFDIDCDFRLIRKSALKTIHLHSETGAICVELVKKLQQKGLAFREVTVHHYPRTYGKSQFFNFRRIFYTGKDLIGLWIDMMLKPHK